MCACVSGKVTIYSALVAGAMFVCAQICQWWPEVSCHQQIMSSLKASCLINNKQSVTLLLIPFLLKFSSFSIVVTLWKYFKNIFRWYLLQFNMKTVDIINSN